MPKATAKELADYAAFPERLNAAIADLTEAQLTAHPLANEWCIQEILVHLADGEANGFFRLRKSLAESEPFLPDYSENSWASNLHYHQQDRGLVLRLFGTLRAANAGLLHLLEDQEWERTGIHEVRGRMTVYDFFRALLDHGEAHLRQIEEVKQALG